MLAPAERAFLLACRRIVMCTVAADGSPRPVPICFAVADSPAVEAECLYTPLDDKPKQVHDPRLLARVRDIVARPGVILLADRWDEDWSRLGWLRLLGRALLLEPGSGQAGGAEEHASAVAALRTRYPQYHDHDLASRPLIRVDITSARSWGSLV